MNKKQLIINQEDLQIMKALNFLLDQDMLKLSDIGKSELSQVITTLNWTSSFYQRMLEAPELPAPAEEKPRASKKGVGK